VKKLLPVVFYDILVELDHALIFRGWDDPNKKKKQFIDNEEDKRTLFVAHDELVAANASMSQFNFFTTFADTEWFESGQVSCLQREHCKNQRLR
jgi:hypothetical protein